MAGLLDYLQNQKPVKQTGEGPYLRQRFPKLYGALGGLLGTAPDEFDGSVLDPLTAEVRKGAEMGYLPGLIAGSAPPMKGAAGLAGLAGMFVGKGSKTWDAVQASRALELEKAGVDARKIWAETGTWKAPDGKWRQEIPDNVAKLKKQPATIVDYMSDVGSPNTYPSKLGTLLDHAQLESAYPGASKTPLVMKNAVKGGSFEVDKFGPSIEIGAAHRNGDFVNPNGVKSTTMHELQHAIQQREGFAEGGSPFDKSIQAEAKRIYDNAINEFSGSPSELMDMAQNNAYRRLAGEAEARATQARIPLDAAARRGLFPADSYDVPMDQLIIRGLLK